MIRWGRETWNRYRRPFLIFYLYLIFINLPLLVLRLTNDYDGTWNQDDYAAGAWELGNGRWLWPLMDKARFRMSLDPLPGIAAMAVFAAGFLVILSALQIRMNWVSYLAGFVFLASTGITCQLSYSFMAIDNASSLLFAALSVRMVSGGPAHGISGETAGRPGRHFGNLIRQNALPIVLSALFLSFTMGCYQVSLGIACLTALFCFILCLVRGKRREGLHFAGRMLCSVILGMVFYLIFLHIAYAVTHTGPSEYQGFDRVTPIYLIRHLPDGIARAYSMFRAALWDNEFILYKLSGHAWFHALYLIPLAGVVILAVRTFCRDWKGGILLCLAFVLIPLFTNCFYLASPDASTHMSMIVPMTLVLPLILLLFTEFLGNKRARRRGICQEIATIVCLCEFALFAYSAAGQCVIDEYAMYVGRRSSETIASEVMNVVEAQGYDYLNGQVLFLGTPAQSQLFQAGDQYQEANAYAQYGNWKEGLAFSNVMWRNFFHHYLRMGYGTMASDTAEDIASLPEVQAMPCFPAAGSVQYVYGVEVVKLSDQMN